METIFMLHKLPDEINGLRPYFIAEHDARLWVIIAAGIEGWQWVNQDEAVRIAGPKLADDLRSLGCRIA